MRPPVTVVTPTFPGREDVLLGRCIPSIQAQEYDGVVDHIVVSDPNPPLVEKLRGMDVPARRPLQVVELNDTWRNDLTDRCTGSFPWRFGGFLAHGQFVGFLGDDDEYLPHCVETHVATMESTGADFTVARVAFYLGGSFQSVIGDPGFACGTIDTTGIMGRQSNLRVANWDIPGWDEDGTTANAGDFRLVRDWRAGGLSGAFIDQVTGNHHDGWMAGASGRPDQLMNGTGWG